MLTILKQALAALRHLHSLYILHRDLRAANVLVDALDPLRVMLSDFGVSHRLSAFVHSSDGASASRVDTVLTGGAAIGPLQVRSHCCAGQVQRGLWGNACVCCDWLLTLQWSAPEVCEGTAAGGTPATTASDVYMLGGLAYELLTAGTPPFDWLAVNPGLLALRRASRDPVPVPGLRGVTASGLLGKSVLEVAEQDQEVVQWCTRVDACPGSPGRLEELKVLVAECLVEDPGARPKVPALKARVEALLRAEVVEARGLGGGRQLLGAAHAESPRAAP